MPAGQGASESDLDTRVLPSISLEYSSLLLLILVSGRGGVVCLKHSLVCVRYSEQSSTVRAASAQRREEGGAFLTHSDHTAPVGRTPFRLDADVVSL